VLHGDYNELQIRKRVLISSDFSTAYKIDHIIDAFEQLDSLYDSYSYLWHPNEKGVRAWRRQREQLIASQLTSKYT
jgi:hypothetical protein